MTSHHAHYRFPGHSICAGILRTWIPGHLRELHVQIMEGKGTLMA